MQSKHEAFAEQYSGKGAALLMGMAPEKTGSRVGSLNPNLQTRLAVHQVQQTSPDFPSPKAALEAEGGGG